MTRRRINLIGLGPLQIRILEDLVQDALDETDLVLGHIITFDNYRSVDKSLASLADKLEKAREELGIVDE